jgi:hypothetical protein
MYTLMVFKLTTRMIQSTRADTEPPGLNVMVTNFSDFLPIFGEKIDVFLKKQCYDPAHFLPIF